MKVSDIMSTSIDFVAESTKAKDICRLIFGRGINGVPVCRNKRIIGFITEKDILSRFFPSVDEFLDDPFREGNFEKMEEKAEHVFSLTADQIMSKDVILVSPETPLLKAQSLMLVNNVSRLPVVNDKGHLVGLITSGDIFRMTVGDRLPFAGEEEYHDWQVRHYDVVTNWEERLKNEIPDLATLFNKQNAKNILDIGYGTGEHDIALAKKDFNVFGIESSSLMAKAANRKLKQLPAAISKKLTFTNGAYTSVLADKKNKFDAAIFMGNAFAHLFANHEKVLKTVSSALKKKQSTIVMQILNIEKMLNFNNRVFDINFGTPKTNFPAEQAFLRFFNPPKSGKATLVTAVFDYNGNQWKFRAINSTPVLFLNKNKIRDLLKKNGFKNISFYGGRFLGNLFQEDFDPKKSECLNVVASR